LFTDDIVPAFGLWYDFRQQPPLEDYARFYAECFEKIEETESLGYAGRGEYLEAYRKAREALGRHGRADEIFPYVASGVAYVRDASRWARSDVAPAIAYQRSRYVEWVTDPGEPKEEPIRLKDLPCKGDFVGKPDAVAEGLARLQEGAPYDHFCFWARLPGLTHKQALESMRPFTSEIYLRDSNAVNT